MMIDDIVSSSVTFSCNILYFSSVFDFTDEIAGSGFKSLNPYRSGYFGTAVKLQPGYTAGIITSFYVSIEQKQLDETCNPF